MSPHAVLSLLPTLSLQQGNAIDSSHFSGSPLARPTSTFLLAVELRATRGHASQSRQVGESTGNQRCHRCVEAEFARTHEHEVGNHKKREQGPPEVNCWHQSYTRAAVYEDRPGVSKMDQIMQFSPPSGAMSRRIEKRVTPYGSLSSLPTSEAAGSDVTSYW